MNLQYKVQWADPKDGVDHVEECTSYGAALYKVGELRDKGYFARLFMPKAKRA